MEDIKLTDMDEILIENHQNNQKLQQVEKITLDDFHLLTIIGRGTYAKVALVRKKNNGQIYALKVLKKKYIQQRKQQKNVMSERKILEEIDNQFIVKMKYAFQDEKKVYFALEYCPGGELFNILQIKRYFNEDQAWFYASQIVLAIEYLHNNDIVYRDLKPENVLLDSQGYVKLTDFGLSKRNIKGNNGAYSICGTPEYLAPEILINQGHGKAVDWWTLGCILFEMIVGQPPFYSTNREELFKSIKTQKIVYPAKINGLLKDLLEKLFQRNPQDRLGGTNGASEVKAHPWFARFDFSYIVNREVKAPFVPKLKNETDVTYFDSEFLETPIYSGGSDHPIGSSDNKYPEFSFNQSLTHQKMSQEMEQYQLSPDNKSIGSFQMVEENESLDQNIFNKNELKN